MGNMGKSSRTWDSLGKLIDADFFMGNLNCRCGFQWQNQETWWGPSEWVTFTQHDDIEISDMANLTSWFSSS